VKEELMADKSTSLILDALTKAMAEPAGVPLHGNKKLPGLFTASASAKEAARRCLEEGYLRVTHSEPRGSSVRDFCALTEKGLAYVLTEVSPKQVLEELVRTLQGRQGQVAELVTIIRQWQAGLESLQVTVEKVLEQIQQAGSAGVPGPPPSVNGRTDFQSVPQLERMTADVLTCLSKWQPSGAPADCPLPELYHGMKSNNPSLTIGQFHDSLRRLHEMEKIYLHPWTGPLYEIPEPACALLVGHEVAYYASVRGS
jgi:hypothetical protein